MKRVFVILEKGKVLIQDNEENTCEMFGGTPFELAALLHEYQYIKGYEVKFLNF